MDLIKARIIDSIEVKQKLLEDKELIEAIKQSAEMMIMALKKNNKIVLCGNGGSASDSAHIAGELVGRFQKERMALPAIALGQDMVSMTAIANDYNYEAVYEREVEAFVNKGDVIVGISTSGNSLNIKKAIIKAIEIGAITIGLLGKGGGKMADVCDISIIIPSDVTARIQESHILIGHIWCELIENTI